MDWNGKRNQGYVYTSAEIKDSGGFSSFFALVPDLQNLKSGR